MRLAQCEEIRVDLTEQPALTQAGVDCLSDGLVSEGAELRATFGETDGPVNYYIRTLPEAGVEVYVKQNPQTNVQEWIRCALDSATLSSPEVLLRAVDDCRSG